MSDAQRKPLTDEELSQLRATEKLASQTPWLPYSRKGGEEARVRASGRWLFEAMPDGEMDIDATGRNCQADNDVTAAAAARNALPRFLDEIDRHRANLKAMEENLKHWPNTMTRERLLDDLRAAREGFRLTELT